MAGRYSPYYSPINDVESGSSQSSSPGDPSDDPFKQPSAMRSMSFYDRTKASEDGPLLLKHPGMRGSHRRKAVISYVVCLALFCSSFVIAVRIWRGPAQTVKLSGSARVHESHAGPAVAAPSYAPSAAPVVVAAPVRAVDDGGDIVVEEIVVDEDTGEARVEEILVDPASGAVEAVVEETIPVVVETTTPDDGAPPLPRVPLPGL